MGQVGDYPYSELTYSRRDPDGTVWGVTRRGLVVCDAGGTGKAEILADLDADDGSMKYCTTDSEGICGCAAARAPTAYRSVISPMKM